MCKRANEPGTGKNAKSVSNNLFLDHGSADHELADVEKRVPAYLYVGVKALIYRGYLHVLLHAHARLCACLYVYVPTRVCVCTRFVSAIVKLVAMV